jgi:hypothetical protein
LGLPIGDDEICSHFSVHTILKEKFFGMNSLQSGYYVNLIQKYDSVCDNIYLFKNIEDIENETLVIHKQPCGFFSNCTLRLFDIILYFNSTKKLPLFVDSSSQFEWYKLNETQNITYEYFLYSIDYDINYENPIDFKEQYQYIDYKNIKFDSLTPFIKKYFSPSKNIEGSIKFIENKYNIENYDNICVLFYRGNDKSTERELPSYNNFIIKARTLYRENNNIKFLIQSDEKEFIETMIKEFPNNSFYFKDEIRSIHKNNDLSVDKINNETNFIYSQYYLAITIIMSKCSYVVCTTGNCSLWISLYRGNSNNIFQINKDKITDYKTHIETALLNAENNISKITNDIINMEGMSGTKTRHFYNNLLDISDARYLEIGTWKGSSVCSAMCGNKAKVICIDNWSEFGGPKNEFVSNFKNFKGDNEAFFIESDCYKVDVSTLPKFNIYMFDGNHTEESHYNALLHYYNCLDDLFIFIVDDWNWTDVRNGTISCIKKLNLKVLYEKEIRTTMDNSVPPQPFLSQNWWNGIYIAILQK